METSDGIFAGINDESPSAANFNMLAARTVTGFAAAFTGHLRARKMNPRMWARRECANIIRVAIKADTIANKMCARNFGHGHGHL